MTRTEMVTLLLETGGRMRGRLELTEEIYDVKPSPIGPLRPDGSLWSDSEIVHFMIHAARYTKIKDPVHSEGWLVPFREQSKGSRIREWREYEERQETNAPQIRLVYEDEKVIDAEVVSSDEEAVE